MLKWVKTKPKNEEWEKFQNDLLTSVRVANDFKTEAQQDLQKMIMENKAHRERVRQLESQIDKLKGNPFVARIFGTCGDHVSQGNSDNIETTKYSNENISSLTKSSENLPTTNSDFGEIMQFEAKVKQYSVCKKNVLVVNDTKRRPKSNKNRKEKVLSKEEKQLLNNLDTLYKEIDPSVPVDKLSEEQRVVKELKKLYEDKGLKQKPVAPTSKDRLAISKPLLGSVYKNPKLQDIAHSPKFLPVENIELVDDDNLDSALTFQTRLKEESDQHSHTKKNKLHKIQSEYFENRTSGDFMEKQLVKSFSLDNVSTLDRNCFENFGLLRLSSAEDLRKCNDRRTSSVRVSVKPFSEKSYFSQTSLDILLRNEDDSTTEDGVKSNCTTKSSMKEGSVSNSEQLGVISSRNELGTTEYSERSVKNAASDEEIRPSKFNIKDIKLRKPLLAKDCPSVSRYPKSSLGKVKSDSSMKCSNFKVSFIKKLRQNKMKTRRTSSVNLRTLEEICQSIDSNLPEDQWTKEQLFAKRFLASLSESERKATLKRLAKIRTQKVTISVPTRESVVRNPKLSSFLRDKEDKYGFKDVGSNKNDGTTFSLEDSVPVFRHSMFEVDNTCERNLKTNIIKKSKSLNDIYFKFHMLERPFVNDENSTDAVSPFCENFVGDDYITETQSLTLDIDTSDSDEISNTDYTDSLDDFWEIGRLKSSSLINVYCQGNHCEQNNTKNIIMLVRDFIEKEKLNESCSHDEPHDGKRLFVRNDSIHVTLEKIHSDDGTYFAKPDFVQPAQVYNENISLDNESYQSSKLRKQTNEDQNFCQNLPDVCQTVSIIDIDNKHLIESNPSDLYENKDKELDSDICISSSNTYTDGDTINSGIKCLEINDLKQVSDRACSRENEDTLSDQKLEQYGARLLPDDNEYEYERPLNLHEIYKNVVREVKEKYASNKCADSSSECEEVNDVSDDDHELDISNIDNSSNISQHKSVEAYSPPLEDICHSVPNDSASDIESGIDLLPNEEAQLKFASQEISHQIIDETFSENDKIFSKNECSYVASISGDAEKRNEEFSDSNNRKQSIDKRGLCYIDPQSLATDDIAMERLQKSDTFFSSDATFHKTNEDFRSPYLLSKSEEDLVNSVKQRYSAALSDLNDFDVDLIERLKQKYLSFDTKMHGSQGNSESNGQEHSVKSNSSGDAYVDNESNSISPGDVYSDNSEKGSLVSLESAKNPQRTDHKDSEISSADAEAVDDFMKNIKMPPHEQTERKRKLLEAVNTEIVIHHQKKGQKESPADDLEDEYEDLLNHGIVVAMKDNDDESFEVADIKVSDVLGGELTDHQDQTFIDKANQSPKDEKGNLDEAGSLHFIKADSIGKGNEIPDLSTPCSAIEDSKDILDKEGDEVSLKMIAHKSYNREKSSKNINKEKCNFDAIFNSSEVTYYEPVYANVSIFSRKPSTSSFSSSKKPVALPRRKMSSLDTYVPTRSVINPDQHIKCPSKLLSLEVPQKEEDVIVCVKSETDSVKNDRANLEEQNSSLRTHSTSMEPGSSDQISNLVQGSSSQVKVVITEKNLEASAPKVFGTVEHYYESQDSNAIPEQIHQVSKEINRTGGAIKKEVESTSTHSSIKRAAKFSGLLPMVDPSGSVKTDDEDSACGYSVPKVPSDIPEEAQRSEPLDKILSHNEPGGDESQLNLFHMDSPPMSRSYLDVFKSKEHRVYEDLTGARNRISGFIKVSSLEERDDEEDSSRHSVTHLKHMFEIRDDSRENLALTKKPEPLNLRADTFNLPKDDIKGENEEHQKTGGDYNVQTNKKDKPKIIDYIASTSSTKKTASLEPLPTYDSLERIAAFHVLNNTPFPGRKSDTGLRKSDSSIHTMDTRKSFTDAKKVFEQLEQSSVKSSSSSSLNLRHLKRNSSEGFKSVSKQETSAVTEVTNQPLKPPSLVNSKQCEGRGSESKVNEHSAEDLINFLGAVDSVEFHEYKMRERLYSCPEENTCRDSKDNVSPELSPGSSRADECPNTQPEDSYGAVLKPIKEDNTSYGELKQYKRKIVLSESDKVFSVSEPVIPVANQMLSSCEQFDRLLDILEQEYQQERNISDVELKSQHDFEEDSRAHLAGESSANITQVESEIATGECYSNCSRCEDSIAVKEDEKLSKSSQDVEIEQNNFTYSEKLSKNSQDMEMERDNVVYNVNEEL